MSKAIYKCIDKYVISAKCREPLHVGGASGEKAEVLIHPVKNIPFVQASGICGAIRGYCAVITDDKTVDNLFGGGEDDLESRIKISDGTFTSNSDLIIELRPRVRIDPETGTVLSASLKGESKTSSGQKFNMQYISSGAKFSFEMYLYDANESEKKLILKAFAAMNGGELQLGGQKSNGCGYITVTEVKHGHYDMKDAKDREKWIAGADSKLKIEEVPGIEAADRINAYEIIINAETESELLVKGIAVNDFGKDAPKAVNIKNAKDEFIIPASSIKGAIRNRMEMIAEYMKVNPKLIEDGFGKSSEVNEDGISGNLKFQDIIIGDKNGENANLRTRIHIDKFTGGVINTALFSELNVFGNMGIHILVTDRNHSEAVVGLLLLAIRDLGLKLYALGGGQNVGKGYIDINSISVVDMRCNRKCYINQNFDITEGKEILEKCLEELRGQIVIGG